MRIVHISGGKQHKSRPGKEKNDIDLSRPNNQITSTCWDQGTIHQNLPQPKPQPPTKTSHLTRPTIP